MSIITFLASVLIWLVVAFSFLVVNRKIAIRAVSAFVVSLLLAQLLKTFIPSPRPFVLRAATPLTLTVHYDNSFPSSHTAAMFALAVTILLYSRTKGLVFIGLAALVGAARVWANVHWPIDILGGAVLGSGVALAVERYTKSK